MPRRESEPDAGAQPASPAETPTESAPGPDSPDATCARLVEELGAEKVEHCNDFQHSLNDAGIIGMLFCNYADMNKCPAGQPMLEREGSSNLIFESRLGSDVNKSEVGCSPEKFQRYDIRFEYQGPKVERVDTLSTFAKLWVLAPAGDFAQLRLRRDPGGAILELYADDESDPLERHISFDGTESPIRLRMRIDLALGVEIYVDDRIEPDAQVDLQFAGEILAHIGLEGSQVEQWARYDDFVVSSAD